MRVYGWYSNVSRGKHRKAQKEVQTTVEQISEVSASTAMCAWPRLIKQVYEVHPLVCPRCGGGMRIIAFIEQPAVIEKILAHLPACADGGQGVVAHPSPQPAEGGPDAFLWTTGHRRQIAASLIHPPAGC